jgi:acyl-CoA hydrolase
MFRRKSPCVGVLRTVPYVVHALQEIQHCRRYSTAGDTALHEIQHMKRKGYANFTTGIRLVTFGRVRRTALGLKSER